MAITSIERTAYPRFSDRQQYHKRWLHENFTLSEEEKNFIQQSTNKPRHRLCIAIQLKTFQYLGYFMEVDAVPGAIKRVIRESIGAHWKTTAQYKHPNNKYRHRDRICQFLGITRWRTLINKETSKKLNSCRIAIGIAYQAAQTMNHPADIINVVIENLVQGKYELPAFSTLDRLVRHTRSLVNNRIFRKITTKLEELAIIEKFDELLQLPGDYNRTGYNALKQLPRSPTISNFKALITHHSWLMSIGNMSEILQDISKVKLSQFAEQAKSLDASDIKEVSVYTRYALIACLLHRSQKTAKDALAKTFCKTIFKIHGKAKLELKEIQEQNVDNAHDVVEFLMKLTLDVEEHNNDPELLVQKIIEQYKRHGGTDKITERCRKVSASNSKNHIPLLWKYYQSKRPALFELMRTLNLHSSTQNRSLTNAMTILLDNASKRLQHLVLSEPLDLSFAPEIWGKHVFDVVEPHNVVNRRYFELCVFTHLAKELQSGDMYVEDADSFEDYRKNLMPWEDCLPRLDQFCKEVNLPNNAETFVQQLKTELTQTALRVDKLYPKLSSLVIDENGVPILKRKRAKRATSTALLEAIKGRMPERNLVDILCNSHYYTGWAGLFGPLSGSLPKLENTTERYIINTFGQGTGMGPAQTARHMKSDISAHMLSWINKRHVNL